MQLVDEGRIDLDAPVKRYVSDFKVGAPDATERITVKMLLDHTNGIDGLWLPDFGPAGRPHRGKLARAPIVSVSLRGG